MLKHDQELVDLKYISDLFKFFIFYSQERKKRRKKMRAY